VILVALYIFRSRLLIAFGLTSISSHTMTSELEIPFWVAQMFGGDILIYMHPHLHGHDRNE
jgi:lipid-A-disaccharide synthase-like uncharacterized protein